MSQDTAWNELLKK